MLRERPQSNSPFFRARKAQAANAIENDGLLIYDDHTCSRLQGGPWISH